MERRRPPETASGYYVLHDFRRIDWDAWRDHPPAAREEALDGAMTFLREEAAVEEGDLGVYSVHGHKADLLILALRPTLPELDTLQRQFEQLEFAAITERATSALGVTEASGYTEAAADFFDPEAEAEPGISRYMNARLYPNLPAAAFLSFYFMDKRRTPDENWYDLPYEERAEHVTRHGEIGRDYAGKVTQMITGSMGFDDWEWGVTLFTDDMVTVKELLTEMRFDPSTSRFAEFGPFYVGDRFPIEALPRFMAGESLSMDGSTTETPDSRALGDRLATIRPEAAFPPDTTAVLVPCDAPRDEVVGAIDDLRGNFDHYDSHVETFVGEEDGQPVVVSGWETERAADTAAGFLADLPGAAEALVGSAGRTEEPRAVGTEDEAASTVRDALAEAGVYSGQPHGEDIHALVRFSSADVDTLAEEVATLTAGFDRYDTHVDTSLYRARGADRAAVVSLWETAEAAETAADYLGNLPGAIDDDEHGFATMGLFYRVIPDHREDFVETFEQVGELLGELDGHRETHLLVDLEDENDMFIASRWRDREAAMEFFRSDEFAETVSWGRDILADRPRHVFLV